MSSAAGLKNHDSILSKLDTFKRKRRSKLEIEQLTKEGREAIESAVCSLTIDDPKNYQLEEGEERSFIEKSSQNSSSVQDLLEKLLAWINNELADQRILVRDIQEDLYDGQILQILVEKLAHIKLGHPEVTQSEVAQLQRLKEVVSTVADLLGLSNSYSPQQWTAELVHQKDLVAILRLMVALAQHFKPSIRFQEGVFLTLIIARKINGELQYRYEREYITESRNPTQTSERHLVSHALTAFANAHLEQLSLVANDPAKDFADGVLLILLMGLIEGYFVPLHAYYPTPTTESMRLANVRLAFQLIEAAGIREPPAQPEDVVVEDSKAILRVLYSIYCYAQGVEAEHRRQHFERIRELDESADDYDGGHNGAHHPMAGSDMAADFEASLQAADPSLLPHERLRAGGITETVYSNE